MMSRHAPVAAIYHYCRTTRFVSLRIMHNNHEVNENDNARLRDSTSKESYNLMAQF